jgi:hypothetical protein
MLRFCLFLLLTINANAFAGNEIPQLIPAEDIKVQSSGNPYEEKVPILLIKCSDYRLNDEVDDFMHKRGLRDKYEEVSMQGGSLGIDNVLRPELKDAFLTQLEDLKNLRDIKMVILMDHVNCDIFKNIHGDKHTLTYEAELQLHSHHLKNVKAMILEKHPDMKVEMLLMSLDGSVDTIKD